MSKLPAHFEQVIGERAFFRRGQRILVAVSGGVDSMVLLHLLHQLAQKHRWQLTVAHLNHKLRGWHSDADEKLVHQTVGKLCLQLVSENADVRDLARCQKLSVEMAARKLRHDFLARTAARLKIPSIALAHHADDQVELFFLRLLRGSGGEGLGGMKWRTPSPENRKIELVRPLLNLPKADLKIYARENKIRFREDASNASLNFQRNRIRHELLPFLKRRYQPALERLILRLMDIVGAEAEFAKAAANSWLAQKKRKSFARLPVATQRRVVELQLQRLNVVLDFDLIEKLRHAPDRPVTTAP
ncbi:MAG TPA: tRNA lysidine(34) synthetase TilS, partial [Verrucomicrobiae bacterium]|nr:tRNA lysidine(34) synthetase TilS [Verrucomicrobiae bacterium]